MTTQEQNFLLEYKALCQRHGLVVVPSHDSKPSAHDPMLIVPLDDFWRDFLEQRVYNEKASRPSSA